MKITIFASSLLIASTQAVTIPHEFHDYDRQYGPPPGRAHPQQQRWTDLADINYEQEDYRRHEGYYPTRNMQHADMGGIGDMFRSVKNAIGTATIWYDEFDATLDMWLRFKREWAYAKSHIEDGLKSGELCQYPVPEVTSEPTHPYARRLWSTMVEISANEVPKTYDSIKGLAKSTILNAVTGGNGEAAESWGVWGYD